MACFLPHTRDTKRYIRGFISINSRIECVVAMSAVPVIPRHSSPCRSIWDINEMAIPGCTCARACTASIQPAFDQRPERTRSLVECRAERTFAPSRSRKLSETTTRRETDVVLDGRQTPCAVHAGSPAVFENRPTGLDVARFNSISDFPLTAKPLLRVLTGFKGCAAHVACTFCTFLESLRRT